MIPPNSICNERHMCNPSLRLNTDQLFSITCWVLGNTIRNISSLLFQSHNLSFLQLSFLLPCFFCACCFSSDHLLLHPTGSCRSMDIYIFFSTILILLSTLHNKLPDWLTDVRVCYLTWFRGLRTQDLEPFYRCPLHMILTQVHYE